MLSVLRARLHPSGATKMRRSPLERDGIEVVHIVGWDEPEYYLTWLAEFTASGVYKADVEYLAPHEARLAIEVRDSNGGIVSQRGENFRSCLCPATGAETVPRKTSTDLVIGPPGEYVIKVRSSKESPWRGLNFWGISLSKLA